MSETIRVVDLSEWTGPVPVENARRMAQEYDVQGAILQAWGSGHIPVRRNEYFHQAVDAFRAAGIRNIDPYIWPPSEWRQALDWIGDYKRFMSGAVYLDVEAGAGVNDEIVNGVEQAGWEPRIYASSGSWAAIMGNTTRYSGRKLWLARYLLRFQRPDGYYVPGFNVTFPETAIGAAGIGGWRTEDLVGWQTTGTVPDFCGESIDSNVFHLSAFQSEEEEEDDPMIQAQMAAAGVFFEIETKLTMGLPIPRTVKGQAIYLLGGVAPNKPSERDLLRVLYRYAGARALRGDPMDDDTIRRLRFALR
jgi:hypothetical protein